MKHEKEQSSKYESNIIGLTLIFISVITLLVMNLYKRIGYDPENDASLSVEKRAKVLAGQSGYYYMSEKGLCDNCIGMTYDEIGKKYRRGEELIVKDSIKIATFSNIVVIDDHGQFRTPTLSFDSDNVCTGWFRMKAFDRSSSWLLRNGPFVQELLSIDLLTKQVQDPPYGYYKPTQNWFINLLFGLVMLFFYALWFILPILLPVGIYYALLPLPLMKWAPSWLIIAPAILLSLIGAYIWAVALSAWGMYWLFLLFFPVEGCAVAMAFSVTNTTDYRCEKCHSVGTIKKVSTRHCHNLIQKERVYGNCLGFAYSRNENYRVENESESEKRETLSHEGKMIYRAVITNRYKVKKHDVVNYYNYETFEVEYSQPVYRDTMKCSHCGYTYETDEYRGERKETGRKNIGITAVGRLAKTVVDDSEYIDTIVRD